MTDETLTPADAPEAAVTEPPTPVEGAAPAVAEPQPGAEGQAAAPTAPQTPRDMPSLVEEMGKDAVKEPVAEVGDKDADPPKPSDGEPKPEQPVEPEAIVYQDFSFPEGLVADSENLTQYTGILGKHRISQEAGQELVDMHAQAMEAYATHVAQEQRRQFMEYRQSQRLAVMSDPELGGSGYNTTAAAVARVRDRLVPEGDREEFEQFLRDTGAGDHRAFVRLLYRAASFIDEPAYPPVESRPPQGSGRSGRLRDFYSE